MGPAEVMGEYFKLTSMKVRRNQLTFRLENNLFNKLTELKG